MVGRDNPRVVTDSGNPVRIRYEHKTEPATNKSSTQDVALSIGVEL